MVGKFCTRRQCKRPPLLSFRPRRLWKPFADKKALQACSRPHVYDQICALAARSRQWPNSFLAYLIDGYACAADISIYEKHRLGISRRLSYQSQDIALLRIISISLHRQQRGDLHQSSETGERLSSDGNGAVPSRSGNAHPTAVMAQPTLRRLQHVQAFDMQRL